MFRKLNKAKLDLYKDIKNQYTELNRSLDKHHHVLILAPHPDDELIGCCGSLLSQQYAHVSVCYLFADTNTDTDRTKESLDVASQLKWKNVIHLNISAAANGETEKHIDDIAGFITDKKISLIYSISPWEIHKEHIQSSDFFLNVLKKIKVRNRRLSVLLYPVWNSAPVNSYFNITDRMDEKKRLLAIYKSQAEFRLNELVDIKDRFFSYALQNHTIRYTEPFFSINGSVMEIDDYYTKLTDQIKFLKRRP